MNIYTYYDDINCGGQQEMIRVWEKNWKQHGFNPIILCKDDAKRSLYYDEYVYELTDVYKNRIIGDDPNNYTLACYLKWLAYSTVLDDNFYVSDYDVINLTIKPDDIILSNKLHFMSGSSPCLVSGNADNFLKMCHDIIDISNEHAYYINSVRWDRRIPRYYDTEFIDINRHLLEDDEKYCFSHHINNRACHVSSRYLYVYKYKHKEKDITRVELMKRLAK